MQPFNDNTTVCQCIGLSSEGEAESQNLALDWGFGARGWGTISQVLHSSEILSPERPTTVPTVAVVC